MPGPKHTPDQILRKLQTAKVETTRGSARVSSRPSCRGAGNSTPVPSALSVSGPNPVDNGENPPDIPGVSRVAYLDSTIRPP
jgi:hypothetical protein